MVNDYIFHIWFFVGFVHMVYLTIKLFPHLKSGHEHYFWLGFWLYKPSALDEEGLRLRKIFIVAMFVYFIGGIGIARSING